MVVRPANQHKQFSTAESRDTLHPKGEIMVMVVPVRGNHGNDSTRKRKYLYCCTRKRSNNGGVVPERENNGNVVPESVMTRASKVRPSFDEVLKRCACIDDNRSGCSNRGELGIYPLGLQAGWARLRLVGF